MCCLAWQTQCWLECINNQIWISWLKKHPSQSSMGCQICTILSRSWLITSHSRLAYFFAFHKSKISKLFLTSSKWNHLNNGIDVLFSNIILAKNYSICVHTRYPRKTGHCWKQIWRSFCSQPNSQPLLAPPLITCSLNYFAFWWHI